MHGCNILNNGEYAIYLEGRNDDTTVIDAVNNWWGVTDSAAIEDIVYHNHDNSTFPIVDYVPFAEGLFDIDDTSIVDVIDYNQDALPTNFSLRQNYPNPFNPFTTIEVNLPRRSYVDLAVYNVIGQKVTQLISGERAAGHYQIIWQGLDSHGQQTAAGMYFYRLRAGDFIDTKKMILLK